MPSLSTILQILGVATAAKALFQLLSFIYLYIRPSSLPRYHHGRPGQTWALVTGASDGIGRGFVDNLLARNFNVLMHGRNADKLNKIAEELRARHPKLQVRTVIADASHASADVDDLVKAADVLPGPLTILVNNVGGIPPGREFAALETRSAEHVDAMINVNARFPTQVTRALLPTLKRNAPALVLNMGSAAERGLPYANTYSASKAFNAVLSRSIKAEMTLEGADVEVLGFLVGNVVSAGNRLAKLDPMTCSSDWLAKQALNRVGCGYAMVWAWWRHAVGFAPLNALPEAWGDAMAGVIAKGIKEGFDKEYEKNA